jgi:hypothetical protein
MMRALASLSAVLADEPPADAPGPTRKQRLTTALVIGLVAGVFSCVMQMRSHASPDFAYAHTAAGLFLDGENPYRAIEGPPGSPAPHDQPLFYPFTAILLLLPFAALSVPVATGLFIGLSTVALAYCITRDGLWRIHVFASAPFVMAATVGQFSPLLMLMAFNPWFGFLAAIKPNIGLALFARRPSIHAVTGSLALLAVSIAVFPGWPADWLESLRRSVADETHRAPVLQAGGFLLLLSVLAWREASGRLLLTLSLIPQALLFYDQLLLWLIPRTRHQSIILTATSQAGMIVWYLLLDKGENPIPAAYPLVVPFLFLPALGVLLWQRRVRRLGTQNLEHDLATQRVNELERPE